MESSEPSTSKLTVDRTGSVPVWLQLMRAIESEIVAGRWQPGDRLPTERELCDEVGISRTSVRTALSKLEQAGLVSRRQGAGAFIEARPEPWAWTMPKAPSIFDPGQMSGRSPLTSRVIRSGLEPMPAFVAAGYGTPSGVGAVIERVRSVGTLPAVHVVNYLRREHSGILPDLRDPHASLYATLARVAGVTIARVHRTVEAAIAERQIARYLEIEEGHPVVVVELVAYDEEGRPVDISRATVRTDRLRIAVDSGHDAASMHTDAAVVTTPIHQGEER